MVHYKLIYFDLRGRGEPIRMIFIYNKIPFEEVRVEYPNGWPAVKPSTTCEMLIILHNQLIIGQNHTFPYYRGAQATPLGKLPVMEIDGKVLPESFAIIRYLARKYDLAGKDDWESAQLDAIADSQNDFFDEMMEWYLKKAYNRGDGDLDTLYKEKWLPAANKHYTKMVQILKELGSGFFAKSGVSWVDFAFADNVKTFYGFDPETMNKYPDLLDHMKRVYSLPQLKEYIEKRKNMFT